MNNTKTPKPTADNNEIASIDVVALEDVTGGCGACGQTCAAGPAPVATAPRVAAFRTPFAFARR
jgi:hypothetical protein